MKNDSMDSNILAYLSGLRSRIVKILYDKCCFRIPNDRGEANGIARLRFQNPVIEGAPGLYSKAENTIYLWPASLNRLREIDYTGILAHELTHCWQFQNKDEFCSGLYHYNYDNIEDEGNIPYEGKLIIEGCANWGEYKVLDYFAADAHIRRLDPNQPSETVGGESPLLTHFQEYYLGFLLMIHLEYHSDFARLLYFLQTGMLPYKPMAANGPEGGFIVLKTARDYEDQLYPDGRLAIDGPMARLPESWKENEGLCIRGDGYGLYPHSGRTADDFARDYPRLTYLIPRIQRAGEGSDDGELRKKGRKDLAGKESHSVLAGKTVDQIVGAGGKGESPLAGYLSGKLLFCCPRCGFRNRCTVFDACHMHSSGRDARSTSALMGAIAGEVRRVESNHEAKKKMGEGEASPAESVQGGQVPQTTPDAESVHRGKK